MCVCVWHNVLWSCKFSVDKFNVLMTDDVRAKQVEVWAVNPSMTRYYFAWLVMTVRNTMWDFNCAFIFRAFRQFSKSKGVSDNLSQSVCLLTNNKTSVFFILILILSANYRLVLPPCVLAVGQLATLIRQTSGQEMAASSCEIRFWG